MRISDWSSDVCSSDLWRRSGGGRSRLTFCGRFCVVCRMGAWTRVEQDPNKARLDSLSKRLGEIKTSQEAETARQRSERGSSKGVAPGMRIVTESTEERLGGKEGGRSVEERGGEYSK